jgi:hypothetical protein
MVGATSVMCDDSQKCKEQKPRAKQEKTQAGTTDLSRSDAALARRNRKRKEQQPRRTMRSFVGLTNNHVGLEAVNPRRHSDEQAKYQCDYCPDYHNEKEISGRCDGKVSRG